MTSLFKLCVIELRNESKKLEEARVEELKTKIGELDEKQQKIVKSMANVTIPEIATGLQQEWNIYNQSKSELVNELESHNLIEKKKLEDLIDSTSNFFVSPQKVFDL